ncbi:unknown [Bacteroides eggerthii CAG:109]|nr:unknown [Bacteroides eggerthii CAG:109]
MAAFGFAGDVFIGIISTPGIGQVGIFDTKAGHQLHAVCYFLVKADIAGTDCFAGFKVSGQFFLHLFFLEQ